MYKHILAIYIICGVSDNCKTFVCSLVAYVPNLHSLVFVSKAMYLGGYLFIYLFYTCNDGEAKQI